MTFMIDVDIAMVLKSLLPRQEWDFFINDALKAALNKLERGFA